jgi:SulP family sulfate permease
MSTKWVPKSVLALKNYSRQDFVADLIAGVTVGLVALPLAMAFAIASGMPPQAGLYCAVIAGFLISALGGSRVQIGGPTGAFVVVIAGIVARYGTDGLFMCTAIAGVFLIFLGVTGLGSTVKYIPRPVVVGFTNGIAVVIASTQIKDFFGLRIEQVPGNFLGRLEALAQNFRTISYEETGLALLAIALILVCRKYFPKIPGYIVALFVGTALVYFLHLPVQTIGTRFGGIPSGLPALKIPHFHLDLIRPLIAPAITVAMLGAIESLMSAVVGDKLYGHGERHKPNVELIAQGVANFISPLMGGLPATGAIARTATNIRSGARTPVAGMIHAVTLLAILMFATPVAKFIPLAVLSAILLVVAYNMGEWAEIPELLKLSRLEVATWAATFVLTVFADLTVAVEAGMILAALVFIRKVTATTTISRVTKEYLAESRLHVLQDKEIPPYATVFRIHGPFLFGAADKIDDLMQQIPDLPPIVILRLRNMTAIDATGIRALEELADRVKASGRRLILCGARELMRQSEFEQHVGPENICANVTEALSRAGALFPQITAEAPSVQKWGRRTTDRQIPEITDGKPSVANAAITRD